MAFGFGHRVTAREETKKKKKKATNIIFEILLTGRIVVWVNHYWPIYTVLPWGQHAIFVALSVHLIHKVVKRDKRTLEANASKNLFP